MSKFSNDGVGYDAYAEAMAAKCASAIECAEIAALTKLEALDHAKFVSGLNNNLCAS